MTFGSIDDFSAVDEERQRPRHRCLAAFAQDVGGHRTMRHARKSEPVEPREQRTGIAVAEIGLAPCGFAEARQDVLQQPARTIAAAREPHRIHARIVGDSDQRFASRAVIAGEMAIGEETLRMEEKLGCAVAVKRARQRRDAFGHPDFQPGGGRDDADLHAQAPPLLVSATSGL